MTMMLTMMIHDDDVNHQPLHPSFPLISTPDALLGLQNNRTPLHIAALHGHFEIVAELLEVMAGVNMQDKVSMQQLSRRRWGGVGVGVGGAGGAERL
jgi:hypothetical protein